MRGWPLTLDHIVPRAAWYDSATPALDPDDPDNLAAACWECNVIGKHARTHAADPFSGVVVPLFHPRHDRWRDHFEWSSDFIMLNGRTPIGWATIRALGLNGARYRAQRRLLRQAIAGGGPAWP
jgi:HNH endonuclease